MIPAIHRTISALAIVLLGGCSERANAQDQLRSEGEQIGIMAGVLGACSGSGYVIDQAMADRLAQEWWSRVQAAGWTEEEARGVYQSGLTDEDARLGTLDTATTLPKDDYMRRYSVFLAKLKPRCHEIATEYPGLITGLDAGDREIDEGLAIAERNIAP